MKPFLYPLLLLVFTYSYVKAQNNNGDYIQNGTLGVHFILNDFKSAAAIRSTSLTESINNKQFGKVKDMSPGLAIGYTKGITNYFDWTTKLAGSFLDFPQQNRPPFGSDYFLLEGDGSIRAKMFSNKYWFTPYAQAGIGASAYKGYWGAFIPLGVGAQVNFFDEAFLILNAQYRVPITETQNYHFFFSVGLAGNVGKKKEPKVIPPPPPPSDRDGDQIVDTIDACPDESGLVQFNGCPDVDADGIMDKEDKCPTVQGTARYQGCPIPDTDLDGINDEEDSCRTEKGTARYHGCPIPDKDGDGVNDEEDRCPEEKGLPENQGCPKLEEFKFNAKNVQFYSGSANLTSGAKKELDLGAQILQEHPTIKVSIVGHTDNTGSAAGNKKLSEQRAKSVKAYLVKKGVSADRLVTSGHGEEQPISNNKTSKGRAENRRVEFKTAN